MLDDGFIKADAVAFVRDSESKKEVGIELHSGRNRIVRRIFESLGYRVEKLDRVAFAGLTKKDIPRGKWRYLTDKEVSFLKMSKK
jgi:23S rRNA pseudouridine2605 synthase